MIPQRVKGPFYYNQPPSKNVFHRFKIQKKRISDMKTPDYSHLLKGCYLVYLA